MGVPFPVGTVVVVTPACQVRGPAYRAVVVGYNQARTRYHVGAELAPGRYARGGSWAAPGEVAIDPLTGGCRDLGEPDHPAG